MKYIFKKLKVKQKLLITFGVLILFLILIGSIGLYNISSINDRTTKIGEVHLPGVNLMLQIDRDLHQSLIAQRTLMNSGSDKVQALLKEYDSNIQQAKERWLKFKELKHEGISAEMINEFEEDLEIWLKLNTKINNLLLLDSSALDQASSLSLGEGSTCFEHAREHINEFTEIIENIAADQVNSAKSEYLSAFWIMSFGSIIIIVISILSGIKITSGIGGPLIKASQMLAEMKKGKLKTRIAIESNDELGAMADSLNTFADTLYGFTRTMYTVADGQLGVNVNLLDKEDEITPALNKIVTTLQDLKKETDNLTRNALEGNLGKRGDITRFNGGYKEIIEGFNATLDAVINPVTEGSEVLQILSTGNLSVRVKGKYMGDHQLIKNNINNLADSLSELISEVTEAVHATASASAEISSSTEQMAAGAHEQSSQTNDVASAVNQISKTIYDTTKNATQAAEHAKRAGVTADEGGKVVAQTVEGINRIAGVVIEASETVKKLGASSNQIGEIIQVIDDIADQTNLLALNAAIEAARAGEMGRGFAVVADEVRKLAERTTKATKEITLMIKQIQADTFQAVDSMSKGTIEVEQGKLLAGRAGDSLKEIISASSKVVMDVNQVAKASEEQSSAADEISKNIESISNVTNESAAGIEQVAHAAEDLNRLTEKLQHLLSRFTISNDSNNVTLSVTRNGKLSGII